MGWRALLMLCCALLHLEMPDVCIEALPQRVDHGLVQLQRRGG